ncbi:MAG: ArsB/NhaD family transporter, partial [Victivallaceae bacterium]
SEHFEKLDTYARYVNFDVIFTLAGMMLLVNILSGTGIFQYIAIKSAKIAKGSPTRTMILLVVSTAILSAFLDNVTTVLLVAPVTLLVAAELGIPAIPFLMAETMASNIGGTATLIGDPPNLIIGSVAHLDFMSFIINLTPFVAIILAIYCVCLKLYYSKRMVVTVEKRARIMELDESAAITDHSNMKCGGIVIILTIIGFLLHGAVGIQPCVVAMSGAALGLAVCKVNVDHALEKIEWSTLFFFMGLFVIVSGAEHGGLMEKFGDLLAFTANWNVLVTVLLVMWVSAIAAAIMNNVSFTAAMVTVVATFLAKTPAFQDNLANQHLMWWGLALAVCLGGNGTIVGAAANLVTAGISEKSGHKITFKEFMIYGFPVTLFSMIASSIYIIIRYFALCR